MDGRVRVNQHGFDKQLRYLVFSKPWTKLVFVLDRVGVIRGDNRENRLDNLDSLSRVNIYIFLVIMLWEISIHRPELCVLRCFVDVPVAYDPIKWPVTLFCSSEKSSRT
jgi:hypothetical protein